MAWLRCGTQKNVIKPPHKDDDDIGYQPQVPPVPQPIPVLGRTKPDRLFSHPVVPLGSKNYQGQYYYEVPDYYFDNGTLQLYRTDMNGVFDTPYYGSSNTRITRTFEPALGTVFSVPGVQTVKFIYDAVGTDYLTGATYHVHREVSQDIMVVNHGAVVTQATPDCPCDIYADGYCFFRPISVGGNVYNYHIAGPSTHGYYMTDVYNYMHYYPKQGQTVAVNKISCLPWYVYSLGTGCGEYHYVSGEDSFSNSAVWNGKYRDNSTTIPTAYYNYTAFLTGDGITPIDISEFSTWSSFYWMRRIDQLFDNVGSVTNYQTLADWNVYGIAFNETFKNVGFSSAMFTLAIKDWNVKATKAFYCMFMNCTGITDTSFLATWDVGRGVNFTGLFKGCSNLVSLAGLANWNVKGPYFTNMFESCTSLTDLTPLANWSSAYHTNTYYGTLEHGQYIYTAEDGVVLSDVSVGSASSGFSEMFRSCTSLQTLNGLQTITAAIPNPAPVPPGTVVQTDDYSSTYLTSRMFLNCTSLTNISAMAGWRASALVGPSFTYNSYNSGNNTYSTYSRNELGIERIFANCISLTDISPLANWDTSTWRGIVGMFEHCTSLQNISVLQNWDLSNCEFLLNVFVNCISIQDFSVLSSWGSSLGNLYGVGGMFSGCALSSFSFLSSWNTTNLRSLDYFLYDVRYSGTTLASLSDFNPGLIQSLVNCFTFAAASTGTSGYYGTSFTSTAYNNNQDPNLFVSCYANFSYPNVQLPSAWGGTKLSSLSGIGGWAINATLRDLTDAFSGNHYLTDISALSGWNTSQVKSMTSAFNQDSWLSDISPLANWNTSNVTNMIQMFHSTSVSNISALAAWDKSKITIYKEWRNGNPGHWVYYNYIDSMLHVQGMKGYSSTLGATVLVTGIGSQYDPQSGQNVPVYWIEDYSGNTSTVLTSTVTLEVSGGRDASSAALWNLSIPANYDQGLSVFAPLTSNDLSWKNVPSWN